MHYACQKQHVCLGSHLTKPCLSCVVTSKTAATHVRYQHSMCNFLSCKILQGPHQAHPTAWNQEGLPFSLPFSLLEYKRKPYTFYHAPSYAPSKQMYYPFTCHAPFNSLVLFPDYFLEQNYNASSIYIYMPCMHTLQGDTSKLQIPYSGKIWRGI